MIAKNLAPMPRISAARISEVPKMLRMKNRWKMCHEPQRHRTAGQGGQQAAVSFFCIQMCHAVIAKVFQLGMRSMPSVANNPGCDIDLRQRQFVKASRQDMNRIGSLRIEWRCLTADPDLSNRC